MTLRIHCDGGARGNPGPAASAFVVLDEQGSVLHQEGHYLGETTNNQAEYAGVLFAVQWLISSSFNSSDTYVTFVLDSELVVRQLIGQYKVKDENLKIRKNEIDNLMHSWKVGDKKFINVRRDQNVLADSLVNQTLDSR
jgi:ribonuclease HI